MSGIGALLLLVLVRPPCLFDEAGPGPSDGPPVPAPPAVVASPAPAAPPPTPAARPPAPVAPPPAPVAQRESARYRIDYGPIPVGKLQLAINEAAPGATIVRADGQGSGAVLGLGRMSNSIATDFDLVRLDSRRWVNVRENDDRKLSDSGEQLTPGQVSGVRTRARPRVERQTMQATFEPPLLDPLAFLLRLRVAPPAPGGPQTLYVLDGQALWRVTVKSAGRAPLPEGSVRVATMRLDGEAEPIHWNGARDESGERRHRSFSIWLSDDANHVPLRLEMPLGPSALVVVLTEIERRSSQPLVR